MQFEEDGITLSEGWQSELPEDLREDKTLAAVKDLPGLAKMLVSAQKMVGADKVVLPGPDATEEDLNAFYTSLGRPADPKGYELAMPEDFPEEVPVDEGLLEAFQETAHKIGLQPAQARQLFDWYNEQTKTAYDKSQTTLSNARAEAEIFDWYNEQTKTAYDKSQTTLSNARAEAETFLRDKWGDKYNDNRERALKAVRTFVNEEDVKRFDETGMGNLPWLVEAFSRIGEAISEDKLAVSHISDNAVTARAEIDRIMGDLNHPYHDKNKPGHVEAVNKVQDLYKRVYPG